MKACTNRASRIICQTKVIFYFNLLSFNMQIHWEIGSPLEPASSGHSRNCNLCHFRVDFIVAAWLELVCTHTTLAEVWRSLNWKSHSHLQKRTFVTSLLSFLQLVLVCASSSAWLSHKHLSTLNQKLNHHSKLVYIRTILFISWGFFLHVLSVYMVVKTFQLLTMGLCTFIFTGGLHLCKG